MEIILGPYFILLTSHFLIHGSMITHLCRRSPCLPTKWTVPTGGLILLSIIWGSMCDVTTGFIMKWLINSSHLEVK